MIEMDEKDLMILRELSKNARTPVTKIAKALGVSDVAVKKRVSKLEKNGVIKKYTLIIDNKKLDYNAVAYIGINVQPDRILDVANYLRSKDNVTFVALTSGDHDLLVELWARDATQLSKELESIRGMTGVVNLYPAIVLDVIKEKEALPQEIFKGLEKK